MIDILQKFFTDVYKEAGDCPIAITFPDVVYNKLVQELIESSWYHRDGHGRYPHKLQYYFGNRLVDLNKETRIDDYIESRQTDMLSGRIVT